MTRSAHVDSFVRDHLPPVEQCPELIFETPERIAAKPDHFDCVDTAADDPALIAFTSGTTGIPKGCVHFHRDVLAMCEVFPRHCLKPGRDDVFIGTPPLAFTFGLGCLLCFPLHARASTVLLEKLAPDALTRRGMFSWSARLCSDMSAPSGWGGGAHSLSNDILCVTLFSE